MIRHVAFGVSSPGELLLVLVAQICVPLMLSLKELSEKIYTGAHLQSNSYKNLVKLYLYAAPKGSLLCAQTFALGFENMLKIFADFIKNYGDI